MKRRDFFRQGLGATVAAGASLMLGNVKHAFSLNPAPPGPEFDMVAIKGDDPTAMFDEGIKAMGGIGTYVSPGQTVVVKPNIGWDTSPERAANTNPQLIKRIVEHCFEAGAKQVYVFDNTCDEWTKCYDNSGIKKAASDAGAKIIPGNTESYYRSVRIPNGKKLKEAKVHEQILDSDVFINVPVLKNHGSAKLTIAMKNLMGIVWDRRYWHRNDLHQCIADFITYKKPLLNIVDAYRVMKRNGPRGVSVEDVVQLNTQLISSDIVAIDAAAAKVFGLDPMDVGHIRIAHEMGSGNIDLDELNIKRIKL